MSSGSDARMSVAVPMPASANPPAALTLYDTATMLPQSVVDVDTLARATGIDQLLLASSSTASDTAAARYNAHAFWTRSDAEIALLLADSRYRPALFRRFVECDYSMQQLCSRMAVLGGDIVSVRQVLVMFKRIKETPPEQLVRMSLEERFYRALTRWRLGTFEHVELCFCLMERPSEQERAAGIADVPIERRYRIGVSLRHRGVSIQQVGGQSSYSTRYIAEALAFDVVQRTRMLLFCFLQNGKPFDRVGYFVNQTPLLNMFVRPITLDEPCWLCSTLVATALQLCSSRYRSALDARRCTPLDVYQAVRSIDCDLVHHNLHYRATGPDDPLVFRADEEDGERPAEASLINL